jgi:hypothetical protein
MSTREERMARIDAAVFRTITDADWDRELRRARSQRNAVSDQIHSLFLDADLGDSQSGMPGILTTDGTDNTDKNLP